MKMFKNKNGKIILTSDKELANLLGYTEEVYYEPLSEKYFKTGIIDADLNRELTEEEEEKLKEMVDEIYENIEDYSQEEISKLIDKYKFVHLCVYRDGEKKDVVAVSAWEEPEQVCHSYGEEYDMWECEPISPIWDTFKDIIFYKNM